MVKPHTHTAKPYLIVLAAILAVALLVSVFWGPIFRHLVHPLYTNAKLAGFERERQTASAGQVVFLGDSAIDSWELDGSFPEYTVYNRGVMGDSTNHILARLPDIYALQPSIVVLLVGTNDFLNEKRTVQQAAAGYQNILDALKANLPHTQVICLSLYPGYNSLLYKVEQWHTHMAGLNSEIKALAARYSNAYVDIYTPMANPATGLGDKQYIKDGIHPSEAGYALIAELLSPLLQAGINKYRTSE